MNLYEVDGFYGTRNRGIIFVYETRSGKRWYCVEEIKDGTNVERLSDIDTMTSRNGINSVNELYDYVIS